MRRSCLTPLPRATGPESDQAIASSLADSEFSFAYAGEGVFLCIARGRDEYNPRDIEVHVKQQLRSGSPVRIGLDIWCGAPLRAGAFRSGDSVRRAIRLAIDSALEKAEATGTETESQLRVDALLTVRVDRWEKHEIEANESGKPSTTVQMKAS